MGKEKDDAKAISVTVNKTRVQSLRIATMQKSCLMTVELEGARLVAFGMGRILAEKKMLSPARFITPKANNQTASCEAGLVGGLVITGSCR